MQIALGLKQLGDDVLLTTTDPANHLNTHLAEHAGINKTVVIDTAPTGHALLLLVSTQSYDRQIAHSEGGAPVAVQCLLPRLRDESQSEFVIVTLPEPTPVLEANRLRADLERAGIHQQWWLVNQCLILNHSTDSFLRAKANSETKWIEEVRRITNGHLVLRPWIK